MNMKKKFIGSLASLVVVASIGVALPENTITTSHENVAQAKEGKVIAKYTLSKKKVKSAAKSMSKNKGNVDKWSGVVSGLFGKWGVPVAAASLASAQAQQKTINTFKKAAKQNKRVQVQIKQGPTPNLDKVGYKIVK
ncbi:hypothetical protein [Staphylococcus gallinarum]|uniref:hypothetical protein n=1 Tax=Staphylococcus gallinarum TaxID=1293 RepID=UPI0030C55505